jgi:hypothetical protein
MFVPRCGWGEGSIADIAANGRNMTTGAGDSADGIDMRYASLDIDAHPACPAKTAAPAISSAIAIAGNI